MDGCPSERRQLCTSGLVLNSSLSNTVEMPSEAAKRRKEKKKTQTKSKNTSSASKNAASCDGVENSMDNLKISTTACTGVLGSHPDARDLHILQLSITFHGVELLVDTKLEVNNGRRYGLIGRNGCGKICVNW